MIDNYNFKYLQEVLDEIRTDKVNFNNHSKQISIDFDGVIHAYSEGYRDGTIYDKPMKNVEKSLQYLKQKGFTLICFSARINSGCKHGKKEMISWLKKYNLLKYFDKITDQKVPCVVYIDDSAIRHKDWISTLKKLKSINII